MITDDLTGRSRLIRNIGTSYASYLVFIVFGFLMPRLIDDRLGKEALGVWDFGWTFVSYVSLSMMGIGSSVNRYVARYRASGDTMALSRTISTLVAVQGTIGIAVLCASLIVASLLPVFFSEQLSTNTSMAVWVVGGLGSALAVQMVFDVWRGVISGCHRWDYHNAISAGGYTVSSICLLTTLLLGGGLKGMAISYLVTTLLTEIFRAVVARRLCPEIELRIDYVNKSDAAKVISFGSKTILIGLPTIITTQTVNVLVVAALGPAALAALARPNALMRHISTLTGKYANVLAPTAGSLQSQNKASELRDFAMQSARAGWLMTIPPLAFMFVVGDLVVAVWMGNSYVSWSTCAVLAAGGLLPLSQKPLLQVMIGLDEHGKIAKRAIVTSLILLVAGTATLSITGWTVTRAAVVIAVPTAFGVGITVLMHGFRHLNISWGDYSRRVLWPAIRLLAALLAALFALRHYSPYSPLMTMCLAMAVTGIVTLALQRKDFKAVLQALRSR